MINGSGKLAPEELEETMQRINFVLQRTMHNHMRWLLCGLLFCCCTLGCSLWPVVCLSKRVGVSRVANLSKAIMIWHNIDGSCIGEAARPRKSTVVQQTRPALAPCKASRR